MVVASSLTGEGKNGVESKTKRTYASVLENKISYSMILGAISTQNSAKPKRKTRIG